LKQSISVASLEAEFTEVMDFMAVDFMAVDFMAVMDTIAVMDTARGSAQQSSAVRQYLHTVAG
jgi:hypothetical protein